ncbi:MAG TPA: hypothetical protein VF498_12475 [Anaerolineales bacterium]
MRNPGQGQANPSPEGRNSHPRWVHVRLMAWWVLGALIAMPVGPGMTRMVLVIGQTQLFGLMGHMIFGIVTALLFIPLNKRI